jgi:hypothetical protein
VRQALEVTEQVLNGGQNLRAAVMDREFRKEELHIVGKHVQDRRIPRRRAWNTSLWRQLVSGCLRIGSSLSPSKAVGWLALGRC